MSSVVDDPMVGPARDEVVLAVDVGGELVKTAQVGAGRIVAERFDTVTDDQVWSLERLGELAGQLHRSAVERGHVPRALCVAVPGQVDDYHGVVQYSANLPWHDVAVADHLGTVVPCDVVVRHDIRAGALAEANLGAGTGVATVFFVAIGTTVGAAGAQSGMVVADHAGAGDLGQVRIRAGSGTGHRVDEFVTTTSLARRYAQRVGADPAGVTSIDVHRLLGADNDARAVWDDAVEALADALEWSVTLFGPDMIVVGGGLSNAGAAFIAPLSKALSRRLEGRPVPKVEAARFGADATLVGAALTGWKSLGWSIDELGRILGAYENP